MQNRTQQNEFEVLSPSGPFGVEIWPAATRLDTLDGKKIAFVWDYVFRGDDMYPMIERALTQRFRDISFVSYDEFGSIFGGEEEGVLESLPAKLQELGIDGAICGVGC
ncbi:MAG: hypothetical protein AAGB04_06595 [Pseudomonadota bacterium]